MVSQVAEMRQIAKPLALAGPQPIHIPTNQFHVPSFFSLQRYIIFLNNQKKKALKSSFRVFRDTQIPMVTIFFLHTFIFI